MKLSLLHETNLAAALRTIYGPKYFGRARLHEPNKYAGIDKGSAVLGGDQNSNDQGIPTNPRYRRFFGIKEG